MSRYSEDASIKRGTSLGTAQATLSIRRALRAGTLPARREILKEGERLDQIAFREYGDGRLWWVIAAASGIGWVMQVPPGTVILIPDSTGF
jgi:nucleoid-associated protein YgaU